jgi:ADP-heptose:LPS heptosyltransferase
LGSAGYFGKLRYDRVMDLCSKMEIKEVVGIFVKSEVVVIGVDTQYVHLSSVLETP